MRYAHLIKALTEFPAGESESGDLAAGNDLQALFAAMLDGGVPELELGGLLVALAGRPSSQAMLPAMLSAFSAALAPRVLALQWLEGRSAAAPRPVVIPAYGAVRTQRNLAPLVALVLQRLHVPVLVHGTLEGHGGVASAYVFRELGIMPSTTLAQAHAALERDRLAFVPTGVIAPGLAQLLSLRGRLGVRGICQAMALLLDPFAGEGMRMVAADDADTQAVLRSVLLSEDGASLLLRGTEGEAFVNPRRRPRIEMIRDGAACLLFEQEPAHEDDAGVDDSDASPRATAAWMTRVLEGSATLPLPILNQLACCIFASGHATDLNEAKAIVAVEARSLAAA